MASIFSNFLAVSTLAAARTGAAATHFLISHNYFSKF